jgi:hypothetical protein
MDRLPKLPETPAVVPEPVPVPKEEIFVTKDTAPAVDATALPTPESEPKPEKKKRQMTSKQLEHLQRMREKASATRQAKLAEKMPNQTVPPTAPVATPTQVPFDIQNQTPPPSPPHHAQPLPRPSAPVPAPQPQYIYHMQQPDMNNYVRREDMEKIVANALDTQHKKIMAEAQRIRQEAQAKKEAEDKEAKQKAVMNSLIRPNVKKNKFY